jgi:hypothetical protein
MGQNYAPAAVSGFKLTYTPDRLIQRLVFAVSALISVLIAKATTIMK